MPWSVGASSAWKNVTAIWVGSGGAWKRVTSIKVGSGGAWKESFATATLSGHVLSAFVSVELIVNADGNVYENLTGGGASQIDSAADWIRPVGAASVQYEVRLDRDTAGNLTGSATETWLTLDSTRSWESTSTGTIETTVRIRKDGVELASAGYDFVVQS